MAQHRGLYISTKYSNKSNQVQGPKCSRKVHTVELLTAGLVKVLVGVHTSSAEDKCTDLVNESDDLRVRL